jgi:putative transposase
MADTQSCDAKSIKMHLKELSGKEAALHRDTSHCISKKIVAKTICASSLIALEDLHDVHERSKVR